MEPSQVEGPTLEPLYQDIWRTKTCPKIKHFLWRCFTNCLSVGSNMMKKKLQKSNLCPRCGDKEESVNHLLFTCPYARVTWALTAAVPLFYPYPGESLLVNMANCFYAIGIEEAEHKERTLYWPWIMWKLWKSRNELIFSNIHIDPRNLVSAALEEASEWRNCQPVHVAGPPNPAMSSNIWSPPPTGILKCNVDASWNKEALSCGVAWILRDDAGEVRWIGAKSYPKLSTPLEAEAAAVTWAAMCLRNMGIKDYQMETDCQSLVLATLSPKESSALAAYSEEIKDYQQASNFILHHSNRLGNPCADLMAKTISLCPIYFAVLDHCCPSWLLPWWKPISFTWLSCNCLMALDF